MTTYNQKDIVLVPFPFSELTYAKKRPALILASIPARDELICMMLTSSKLIDQSVDIPIDSLDGTGLPKPTVARTSRLFTLKGSMVVKRLGQINDSAYAEIVNRIIQIIKPE